MSADTYPKFENVRLPFARQFSLKGSPQADRAQDITFDQPAAVLATLSCGWVDNCTVVKPKLIAVRRGGQWSEFAGADAYWDSYEEGLESDGTYDNPVRIDGLRLELHCTGVAAVFVLTVIPQD